MGSKQYFKQGPGEEFPCHRQPHHPNPVSTSGMLPIRAMACTRPGFRWMRVIRQRGDPVEHGRLLRYPRLAQIRAIATLSLPDYCFSAGDLQLGLKHRSSSISFVVTCLALLSKHSKSTDTRLGPHRVFSRLIRSIFHARSVFHTRSPSSSIVLHSSDSGLRSLKLLYSTPLTSPSPFDDGPLVLFPCAPWITSRTTTTSPFQ